VQGLGGGASLARPSSLGAAFPSSTTTAMIALTDTAADQGRRMVPLIAPRPASLQPPPFAAPMVPLVDTEKSVDAKRLAKREKNRRSAQLCRQRKKRMLADLETENQALTRHQEIMASLSDMIFSFDGRCILREISGSTGAGPRAEQTQAESSSEGDCGENKAASLPTTATEHRPPATERHSTQRSLKTGGSIRANPHGPSQGGIPACPITFASPSVETTLQYGEEEIKQLGFLEILSYQSRTQLHQLLRATVSRHAETFASQGWWSDSPRSDSDEVATSSETQPNDSPHLVPDSAREEALDKKEGAGAGVTAPSEELDTPTAVAITEILCSNLAISMRQKSGTVLYGNASAVLSMSPKSVEVVCSIRPCWQHIRTWTKSAEEHRNGTKRQVEEDTAIHTGLKRRTKWPKSSNSKGVCRQGLTADYVATTTVASPALIATAPVLPAGAAPATTGAGRRRGGTSSNAAAVAASAAVCTAADGTSPVSGSELEIVEDIATALPSSAQALKGLSEGPGAVEASTKRRARSPQSSNGSDGTRGNDGDVEDGLDNLDETSSSGSSEGRCAQSGKRSSVSNGGGST